MDIRDQRISFVQAFGQDSWRVGPFDWCTERAAILTREGAVEVEYHRVTDLRGRDIDQLSHDADATRRPILPAS